MNELSCRQVQYELRKRRLNSIGKKCMIVKRFKIAYENQSKNDTLSMTEFNDLSNEIYREIFDYLCPFDIVYSFHGLNYRLNSIIGNIQMKLNFSNLKQCDYKRVFKHMIPKIMHQTVAINIEQSYKTLRRFSLSCNAEYVIDLFMQSYSFTQFPNLQSLSITAANQDQLESLFRVIPNMTSLRSLRLYEQTNSFSLNETFCKLTIANNAQYSAQSNNHLAHIFIETNPPFKILALLRKYFLNKQVFDCIQINIRCALFFYPHALKFIDCHSLSNLISNMNYFRIDVTLGEFQPMFDLIQRFSKARHLTVRTVPQAYANGHQWAKLLSQMPNIDKLDFDISLDSSMSDQELETFQTEFWRERKWIVQYIESRTNNISNYKIVHRSA